MEIATELATALKAETIRNYVREVGINANHWYAVAWAQDVRTGKILPVMVWSQSIALFRDSQGKINAVENVCAHKGVAIDKGKVMGDTINIVSAIKILSEPLCVCKWASSSGGNPQTFMRQFSIFTEV